MKNDHSGREICLFCVVLCCVVYIFLIKTNFIELQDNDLNNLRGNARPPSTNQLGFIQIIISVENKQLS